MLATFQIPPIDPGAPLWGLYDSSYGITLNDLVVLSPNAFDNAAWTKNLTSVAADSTTDPFGGSAADSLIEDNTNNVHNVAQAPAGFVANLPVQFSVYAKASTRTWLFLAGDGFTKGVYFNLSTGTFGSTVGTVTAKESRSLGNGWYQVTITFTPAAGSLFVALASGDGVNSYLGDAVSKIFIYGASATQPKVSQWTDQSLNPATGALNGNDLIQATAANQFLYTSNGWNGRPSLRADGSNDFMKTGAKVLNQPCVIMAAVRMNLLTIAGNNDIFIDGNAFDTGILAIDQVKYVVDAGAGLAWTPSVAPAAGVQVVMAGVFNGVPSQLRLNGASHATGSTGAGNPSGLTIGASGTPNRFVSCDYSTIAVFSGLPSEWTLTLWERWMMARNRAVVFQ